MWKRGFEGLSDFMQFASKICSAKLQSPRGVVLTAEYWELWEPHRLWWWNWHWALLMEWYSSFWPIRLSNFLLYIIYDVTTLPYHFLITEQWYEISWFFASMIDQWAYWICIFWGHSHGHIKAWIASPHFLPCEYTEGVWLYGYVE